MLALTQFWWSEPKMDPRLAEAVMSKLLYKPKYSEIPSQAQRMTVEILEAVYGREPKAEAQPKPRLLRWIST
jgi:hypothetical protein